MSEQQPHQGGQPHQQSFQPQQFSPEPMPADVPPPSFTTDPQRVIPAALQTPQPYVAQQGVQPPPPYASHAGAPASPAPYDMSMQGPFAAPSAPTLARLLSAGALGLASGMVIGLIYALVTAAIQRDFFIFVFIIAVAVGVVVKTVAKWVSFATGVVAAIATFASVMFAEYLSTLLLSAGSIAEGFSWFTRVPPRLVFEAYFSDVLSYVWVIGAVAIGFFQGFRDAPGR